MSDEGASQLADELKAPLIELLLAIADDKLVLGHRNSDWTGLAPILEEDIAFSALAQDEMAHARALYELIAPLAGRGADELAFGRPPQAMRCAAIVELPDDFDWAFAICRQFLCDHFDLLRLSRLARSSYRPLAELAARLAAEEKVHVEHADGWLRRLGRGTDDSRTRMQGALDRLGEPAGTLLEPTEGQEVLEAAGVYPPAEGDLPDAWMAALRPVLDDAKLKLQPPRAGDAPGGRRGRHSEHLAPLLDEMCEVYRLEPGAAW